MMATLTTGIVLAAAVSTGASADLRQRVVSPVGIVDDHIIVGRARCDGAVWLLTDAPALVQIKTGERTANANAIVGLRQDDRPFGLACIHNDSLWTLTDVRTLARLSFRGEVVQRTDLRQPRLNVFGAGPWLVLQQSPLVAGAPLLARATTADVNHTTPWPGVLARASWRTDLQSAIVGCSLPERLRLACWIATQARITVSDGVEKNTVQLEPAFIGGIAIDPRLPLRDVALSPRHVWILTSAVAGPDGRRVGGRLTRSTLRGDDEGHADLAPRARLILDANDTSAVVLSTAGSFISVEVP